MIDFINENKCKKGLTLGKKFVIIYVYYETTRRYNVLNNRQH